MRPRTDYIVLHTTEGKAKGSLRKVWENGEAHYFVDTNGRIYKIIDRKRVAFHAGRSMWEGRSNLDNYSIGIESVGVHNGQLTTAQTRALAELVTWLKKTYNLPDDRVLTHCMVAYGAPNRWHGRSHRGRKRCGMLFARKSVRRSLGLNNEPAYDPDVRAGRLVVGDPYLAQMLYGNSRVQERATVRFVGTDATTISSGRSAWDIAGEDYRSADTLYIFPDKRQARGNQITQWNQIPAGTRVVLSSGSEEEKSDDLKAIGRDGVSARDIAGEEWGALTTVYFLPDGRVRFGHQLDEASMRALPSGTRMLVRYRYGGMVAPDKNAFSIGGKLWNAPSTFYRFPDGSVLPGNRVKASAIPNQTLVFHRN